MPPLKIQEFDFGRIEFYDSYAIGKIKSNRVVDTTVARSVLNALKEHYGKRKMVYISDREFGHSVDLSVYKLIDSRKMVAIAIVSSNKEEVINTAGREQAVYSGSFGVFNTMDSAVSWAQSFVEEEV